MMRTTSPSVPIRMKAFGAKASDVAASLRPIGRLRLTTSPPPRAALVARKLRRDRPLSEARDAMRSTIMSASLHVGLRGELDRLADAHISPAAADVAAHCVIDVGIGGMRIAREHRRGRHDLSGLAVAAL